jgi:serine/threonine-protein kinase
MGVVCAATHLGLETPVAIKVVRTELANNPDATSRFLNEAKAAAGLKGEHVARVIDFGTLASGAPYMAMEFLRGSDLWSIVANQGPLPIATTVDYVLQACEALAEAHATRLIHRDVKPENLFLAERPDGTFTIKVLDFGISKQLAADRGLTNPKNGLGSPYYMSPEQMCSPSDVDVRTDIWSIGCVLYVLLTGQLPFYCESIAGVCAKVLNERPPPPHTLRADVPPGLEAVIFRCLQKDRRGRFDDIGELVNALGPFGTLEGQQCITRVHRILARSSDPPALRDSGAASFPQVAALPLGSATPHAAATPHLPPPRADSPTPARVVRVVETPIPVLPLVRPRRRAVRRMRPEPRERPRGVRPMTVLVLIALVSGAALFGADRLGYVLPSPIGGALLPHVTDLRERLGAAPTPPPRISGASTAEPLIALDDPARATGPRMTRSTSVPAGSAEVTHDPPPSEAAIDPEQSPSPTAGQPGAGPARARRHPRARAQSGGVDTRFPTVPVPYGAETSSASERSRVAPPSEPEQEIDHARAAYLSALRPSDAALSPRVEPEGTETVEPWPSGEQESPSQP